jgi:hypothetical protein
MRHGPIVALLLALAAGSAMAQTPPADSDATKAMLGAWEMSNADRDRTCILVFKNEPGPGGLRLDVDRACTGAFPVTKDVVAWGLGEKDVVRLLDARGRTLLELSEVESGIYEGQRPGEGLYFLQSLAAAANIRTPEQMVGDWAVVRGGKTICTLTLTNTGADPDSYTLRVKPGCDAFVTRFAPSLWRIERGELVFLSQRGQAWRFEETDPMTWHRVPASDPVLLVRQ